MRFKETEYHVLHILRGNLTDLVHFHPIYLYQTKSFHKLMREVTRESIFHL